MVPGRGVRHAGRHVCVRAPVPGEQRDAVRGLLPVPGGTGAQLSPGRGPGPVPGVLRGAADGHRVFLRHDGQAPDQQHQEHAGRSTGQYHVPALTIPTVLGCFYWAPDLFPLGFSYQEPVREIRGFLAWPTIWLMILKNTFPNRFAI